MNINVTIVFQAAAFFISYYFLKKYLYVPLFAVMQKQQTHKQALQEQIFSWQYKKQSMAERKKLQWMHIVKVLKSAIPFTQDELEQPQIACAPMKKKSEPVADYSAQEKAATQIVISKLSSVHHD